MAHDPTATGTARQPRGWCPTCRSTQLCTPKGVADAQQHPATYLCDGCGGATHEPVIRLTPPFMEAALGLGA